MVLLIDSLEDVICVYMSLRDTNVGEEVCSVEVPHEPPGILRGHGSLSNDDGFRGPCDGGHTGVEEGKESTQSGRQIEYESEDDEAADIADLAL